MKISPDCSLSNYAAWPFMHGELLSIRCQHISSYSHNTLLWGSFLFPILITHSKILECKLHKLSVWVNSDTLGVHAQFMLCAVWDAGFSVLVMMVDRESQFSLQINLSALWWNNEDSQYSSGWDRPCWGWTWTERNSLFLLPAVLPADPCITTSVWHIC